MKFKRPRQVDRCSVSSSFSACSFSTLLSKAFKIKILLSNSILICTYNNSMFYLFVNAYVFELKATVLLLYLNILSYAIILGTENF